ncbi:MAG: aquaporin [Candidatus Omnitrophica bacterium]|nr:aquaporin [Candidatus Omnitrophota bacterium]
MSKKPSLKPLIAEFIGTFTLIFIGVGAIAADQMTGGKLGLTGIALAHGLAIGVMVSATMAISGGHLNPAVTIGLWFVQKIDSASAIGYVAAQCLGAIFAALLIKGAVPAAVLMAVGMGTPALGSGITVSMALLTEIILTFFLVFVVYGTAVDARAPKCGGLFIGLAVALDILMGGPISGAAMNPARYIGPALLGGGLQHWWIYWLGPICGGILATVIYRYQLEK